jgi:hypothetical protein
MEAAGRGVPANGEKVTHSSCGLARERLFTLPGGCPASSTKIARAIGMVNMHMLDTFLLQRSPVNRVSSPPLQANFCPRRHVLLRQAGRPVGISSFFAEIDIFKLR